MASPLKWFIRFSVSLASDICYFVISRSVKLNSASEMSAKFDPRFSRKPIGPPFLMVCSMPRILKVIKNLIADILSEFTKILLTLGCFNSTLLSIYGFTLKQTSSFAFTTTSTFDSVELPLDTNSEFIYKFGLAFTFWDAFLETLSNL